MPDRLIFAIVYAESMFGLVGYIVHKQGLSREIWNFYADLWIVSINLIKLSFYKYYRNYYYLFTDLASWLKDALVDIATKNKNKINKL